MLLFPPISYISLLPSFIFTKSLVLFYKKSISFSSIIYSSIRIVYYGPEYNIVPFYFSTILLNILNYFLLLSPTLFLAVISNSIL